MKETRPVEPLSVPRRTLLRGTAAALAAWTMSPGLRAQTAGGAASAVLAVPGPRNSVSLPLELAVALGHDRAAGLPLRLKFVGGGGVAVQDMRNGNAEFGVFGLPAMVRANTQGGAPMVALAAQDDLALYTLVVRADLRNRVRKIGDLAGRTLGVHSNSLQVRTTSHQLADYLLQLHGVDLGSIKFLAAGQSWETLSAMLVSRAVDATMCDEPFATRLVNEGLAFRLFSTGNPEDVRTAPGTGFLRAVLVAPRSTVSATPERCERMVRTVQRTLAWMAANSPPAMADVLGMKDAEREAFLTVARLYPRQYSRDGRFPAAQIAETTIFFRASNADLPAAAGVRVADMLVDRWVGRAA